MLAFSGIENTPIDNTDTDRAAAVTMGGGVTEEEGSLVLPDGTSLYTKSWKPEGRPRAVIAFYHGFSDHCNSFFDFFPNLASAGFEVRSLDQRGWGRSVISNRKLRGHYGSTATVMTDLHFFLQSLIPFTKEGSIPLFLMGHSMGGMNALYYALNPESPYHQQQQANSSNATTKVKLAGVLSVAPLVAVHPTTQPLKIVEYAGRIARHIIPKMTMVQKIDAKWVSKNQAVVDDIKNDNGVLYHNTGTLEGLAGMLDRGAWLNDLHKKTTAVQNHVVVPALWVGHGTEDRITWFDATRRLVQSLDYVDDKTFKEYEGAYHKLMNEPDGVSEAMTKDATEWIEARLPKGDA